MAGRRAQPPGPVPAMSLAATGHPPTDRVLKQVETATQDLQTKARAAAATATDQGTALTALTTRVTALEGEVGGRLLAVQILTGATTGALNALTARVHIRLIAGGGGGGGGAASAGSAAGAGGGTGIVLEAWATVTPGGTFTYSAPTAQAAGGSNAGAAGATGSDATLTLPTASGNVTYTAKGGTGGGGSLGSAGDATAFGGAGQAGSTSGTGIIGSGGSDRGEDGLVKSGIGYSGMGGSLPPYGTGGAPGLPGTDGGDAVGYGAGGAGANATAAGKVGGKGAAALIIIEEHS